MQPKLNLYLGQASLLSRNAYALQLTFAVLPLQFTVCMPAEMPEVRKFDRISSESLFVIVRKYSISI